MAEYIEREELMKFPIRRDRCDKKHANEHFINGIETVMEYAENLPIADVAPVVHGRWIVHKTATGREYTLCGRCNTGLANYDKGNISEPMDLRGTKYCPSCGAKMDGGDTDA